MEPNTHSRVTFATKLGAIAAAVGSAVGLGNIWRFPYVTGQNGGGAFLFIYLLAVFALGIPLIISEFLVGRTARSNAAGSFKKLAPHTFWPLIGHMGILSVTLILGFYTVIAGWTLEYVWMAIANGFSGLVDASADAPTSESTAQVLNDFFVSFRSDPVKPVVWMTLFIMANFFILLGGVEKGIERASNVMMPVLFFLLLVLCVNSFTLSGATEGLNYLFSPDFSKITGHTFLIAIGQAFFSLSLGLGCLITYGSYMGSNTKLGKTSIIIALLDTLVAVLSGIIIFPAIFTYGIDPQAGPGLVFVTLPNVFLQMPGGYFWSVFFFVLITLAALSSTVSMFEVPVAFLMEEFKVTRKSALIVSSIFAWLLGIACSLSMGDWSQYTIFGLTIFEVCDFVSANILMPLGALLISLFVGWRLDRAIVHDAITNSQQDSGWYVKPLIYALRYFAPLCIVLIFLFNLGFFG